MLCGSGIDFRRCRMAESDNAFMTVREAGRKGGKTTRQRKGPEFYQEIGQ